MQRIAVIGTGIMGAGHAKYLTDDVSNATVVALCDVNIERANSLAQELGTVKLISDNVEEIMNSELVDAILIASPDALHFEHLKVGIKTKKPILCEKPIAINIEDAIEIAAEIRKSKESRIVFGFMRRFDPAFIGVRTLIESGKYGKPLFVRVVSRNHSSPGVTSSGMFTNMAVHDFDIYRWLFNTEWKSIQSFYPVHTSESPEDLRDPLIFVGTLQNGIMIVEDVIANGMAGYDTRAEIVCERGNIEIGIHGDIAERTGLNFETTQGGIMETNWLKKFNQAYINELNAWVEEIESGTTNSNFATEYDAVKAIEAGSLGISSS